MTAEPACILCGAIRAIAGEGAAGDGSVPRSWKLHECTSTIPPGCVVNEGAIFAKKNCLVRHRGRAKRKASPAMPL
jgi:hypothetical protein